MNRFQFEGKLARIKQKKATEEVLKFFLEGYSDKEIAELTNKKRGTVRKQISNIYKDFGVKGRYETDRTLRRSELVELFERFSKSDGRLQQYKINIWLGEDQISSTELEPEPEPTELDYQHMYESFCHFLDKEDYINAFYQIFNFKEYDSFCLYEQLNRGGYFHEVIDLFECLLKNWIAKESEIEEYFTALSCLGDAYRKCEKLDLSVNCYQVLLQHAIAFEDYQNIAGTYTNLGLTFSHKRQFKDSIDHSRIGLKIARKLEYKEIEGLALNNLGIAYEFMEQLDIAIDYYHHSIEVRHRLQDFESEAHLLINLGNVYRKLEEYAQSIEYLNQGVNMARELQYPEFEANGLYNLALALEETGEMEEAMFAATESLQLYKDMELEARSRDTEDLIKHLQNLS